MDQFSIRQIETSEPVKSSNLHNSKVKNKTADNARGVTLLSWLCGVCLFSFLYETLLPATPHMTSLFPYPMEKNAGPLVWLMAGVAIGTLAGGAASDRLGRRNTLLTALVIAGLGSLISFVFVKNWSAFVSGRLLAGSGSGAALVLCRVSLREECELSRQLLVSSYLSLSVALTTVTSPLLGILTFEAFGLSGLLLLNLVFSGFVLFVAIYGFKETQKIKNDHRGLANLFSDAGKLLHDSHFLLVTSVVTLAWVIFVLLGASLPTLLQGQFSLSRKEYAVAIAAAYFAYFFGIRVSRQILSDVGPYVQIIRATLMLVLVFGTMIVYVMQNNVSAYAFIGAVVCVYFLLGFILPLAQALVMRDKYPSFGLVASLFYFTELLCGAVALWVFSAVHGDLLTKLVVACLVTATVLSFVGFGLAARVRHI